jgi:hypothetical protein
LPKLARCQATDLGLRVRSTLNERGFTSLTAAARSAKAQAEAGHLGFALQHINPEGPMSRAALVRLPKEERVPTPSGKGQWAAMTVKRLQARIEGVA